MRSITRNELYGIIKRANEPTFDGKLRFMESEILKQYADNDIILKDVRHRLSIVKHEFKQKWTAANNTKARFEEKNANWLNSTIFLPAAGMLNCTLYWIS